MLNDILSSLSATARKNGIDNALVNDIPLVFNEVLNGTTDFCLDKNLINGNSRVDDPTVGRFIVANEAANIYSNTQYTGEAIADLVSRCGIPESRAYAAAKFVAKTIDRYSKVADAGSLSGKMLFDSFITSDSFNKADIKGDLVEVDYNNIFDREVAQDIGTFETAIFNGKRFASGAKVGNEAFGLETDKIQPDLNIALAIGLTGIRVGMTPTWLTVRSAESACITIEKSTHEVFNMEDNTINFKRGILDLYYNPTRVANVQAPVNAYVVNDTAGVMVSDNLFKVTPVPAELLKLAISNDDFAATAHDRTDIVATGGSVKAIRIKLTLAGEPATEEIFEVEPPSDQAAFLRFQSMQHSTNDFAKIAFPFLLDNTAVAVGETDPSTILATLPDGAAVKIDLRLGVDLVRYGATLTSEGSIALSGWNTASASIIPDELADLLETLTVEFVGYSVDLHWAEDVNQRKATIGVTSHKMTLGYYINQGRVYTHDYSLPETSNTEAGEMLATIQQLGLDWVISEAVVSAWTRTARENVKQAVTNPLIKPEEYGYMFPAGSRIRPYVFSGELDFAYLSTIKSADRSGDIRQFVVSFFDFLIGTIKEESLIGEALVGKNLVFNCTTSPLVIAAALGQRHIYTQLDKEDRGNISGTAIFRMTLSDGTVLNFIPTLFENLRNKITMVPVVPGEPNNVLNGAVIYDYGSITAHFTMGAYKDRANHRMYTAARQLPVIQAPVGAIIDVKNLDKVSNFKSYILPRVENVVVTP